MSSLIDIGRFLILAGTIVMVVGFVLVMADKLPIGRLPGDVSFGNGRFQISIPIATCVLLSVVITVVVNLFNRR
jgi:hypothetical protein